jgi:trans-aconitate methyltransferase
VYERQILREICAAYPATSHAIDWGAGGGDLTNLLVEHFQQVYVVEPHPGMRAVLATRCPRAQIVDGTLMSAVLSTQVDFGLISHMLYHVPDHKWGAYTMHTAQYLTAKGVLIVTLKTVDTGCNQMLEYFGAPRYDLQGAYAV